MPSCVMSKCAGVSRSLVQFTRSASNRSWLEVDLEQQQATKALAKLRALRPSTLTTSLSAASLLPLEDAEDADRLFDYDYDRERLPPSPFSSRSRIKSGRTSPTSPRYGPDAGDDTDDDDMRLLSASLLFSSASLGSTSRLLRPPTSASARTSNAFTDFSRTTTVSSLFAPRPWYMQPTKINDYASPRRYGKVKAFGSSPSRFPTPRHSFFGTIGTTPGTSDGSTYVSSTGIWSTP